MGAGRPARHLPERAPPGREGRAAQLGRADPGGAGAVPAGPGGGRGADRGGGPARPAHPVRRAGGLRPRGGVPAAGEAHPLVGRRIPDLRLAVDEPGDAPRLYEALRGGRAVLVSNDEQPYTDQWASRVVTAAPADPHGKLRDTVLLVRPDGYAAWAAVDPTRTEVRAALTALLGRPTQP
ncbi:hypothetical protein ACFQ1I_24090 [Kitasatospora arboriphila]